MNIRRLIIFFVIFAIISFYYFHHELTKHSQEELKKATEAKVLQAAYGQEIHYLSLQHEKLNAELEKRADGMWYIIKPVIYKADDFVVNGIVSTITIDKKIRDLSDTTFDFETIGLSPPRMRIGIGYGEIRRYLLLGDETYVGGNYYARWEDNEKDVFLVSKNFYAVFKKSLYALRDKNIFIFNDRAVKKLDCSFDGGAFSLEKSDKNEGEWWITSPYENHANGQLVTDYLRDIRSIRVEDFFDELTMEDDITGLVDKKKYIAIHETDYEETLYIGKPFKDGKSYYAYRVSSGTVLSVAADILEPLVHNADYFLDKRIFSFAGDDIVEFIYQKDTRHVRFVRDNEVWRNMTEGTETADKDTSHAILEFINFCAELQYDVILDNSTDDVRNLTPEHMICSFTFMTKENTVIKMDIYTIQDNFILKGPQDPNHFTITPTDYAHLNDHLKRIF